MNKPVIFVRGLGKKYRLGATIRHDTLRDQIANVFKSIFSGNGNKSAADPTKVVDQTNDSLEFWALKGVSFDVNQGEVIGIIGRNGAGKSTLLKILSEITEPTTGEIRIRGRVGSLLEVGTGFHPELTGWENIYMNGAILGMTKAEIKSRFDEIVDFAEIEKFLDTPVKRYSSGMYVRLAFAVAAHLNPEILFIDEVLAVGDFQFQNKCLGKMGEVSKSGRTILFVSHNMGAISKLCHKSIVLDQGEIAFYGNTNSAVRLHLGTDKSPTNSLDSIFINKQAFNKNSRYRITGVELIGLDYRSLNMVATGDFVRIRIHYDFLNSLKQPSFGLRFFSDERSELARIINYACGLEISKIDAGKGYIDCVIKSWPFCKGLIFIDLDLVRRGREQLHLIENAIKINVAGGDYYGSGIHFDQAKHHGFFILPHEWQLPSQ